MFLMSLPSRLLTAGSCSFKLDILSESFRRSLPSLRLFLSYMCHSETLDRDFLPLDIPSGVFRRSLPSCHGFLHMCSLSVGSVARNHVFSSLFQPGSTQVPESV